MKGESASRILTEGEQRKLRAIHEYRDDVSQGSREKIESLVEKRFYSGKYFREARRVLCLPKEVRLSTSERSDIDLFVRYAGKRLVMGERHGDYFHLAEHAPEQTGQGRSSFDPHDMSHAIAKYALFNRTTPEFLTATSERHYEDPTVAVEEYGALLFGGVSLSFLAVAREGQDIELENFFGNFKDEHYRQRATEAMRGIDKTSWDDVFTRYCKLVEIAVEYVAVLTVPQDGSDPAEWELLRARRNVIAKRMRQTFDEAKTLPQFHAIRELAARMYAGRHDPKIAVKIFQETCAPLLARLRAQKNATKKVQDK